MKRFGFAASIAALTFCSTAAAADAAHTVSIPAAWSAPFILLLACIALMPFINKPFWEHYYPHVSIGLGLIVAVIYVTQLGAHGAEKLLDTGIDYFKFIALVGSLFVISGGILIELSGGGKPSVNALLLICGVVLANIVGTTGASALLIRPFLRINKDRLRPFHVVLFIFIVANCAGALTPIGDPPLFLGYINGVQFRWTILHCWKPWLLVNALLIAVFVILDATAAPKTHHHNPNKVVIAGWRNVACLGIVLFGVFLDQILFKTVSEKFAPYPLGAIVMLLGAFLAYKKSDLRILHHNEFNFGPIKEVALLFVGIFVTMMPALAYLAQNAAKLGINTPGGFYFTTGSLSSVLDNAPAYLTFLSAAMGLHHMELNNANVAQFAATHGDYLRAVSLGAVFFGACTYIGNGPNFMVKAIADAAGAHTPSFFAYIFKYTLPILIPIFVLVWFVFLSGAI